MAYNGNEGAALGPGGTEARMSVRRTKPEGLGREGEGAAFRFLVDQGFRVVERNYRAPCGEIDLIAVDGDTLVFIEVKTRRSRRFGEPFEAVDPRKQKRMTRAALWYLKRFDVPPPCRFDVVSISRAAGLPSVRHIRNAFEAV